VKYLLDTNVYIEACRSEERRVQFRKAFFPLLPFTFLSATVAYELAANASDQNTRELITDFAGRLERVGRTVTPIFSDWIEASEIMTRIAQNEKSWRSKLPQLQNDILIALSARRIGATVLTYNREDFLLIRRHKHFSVRILKLEKEIIRPKR
jgi:predicted nucleic acid-binding protein